MDTQDPHTDSPRSRPSHSTRSRPAPPPIRRSTRASLTPSCPFMVQVGWTALMLAAFDGQDDIVNLLVKAGADVTLQGGNPRRIALAWAKHANHAKCVAILEAAQSAKVEPQMLTSSHLSVACGINSLSIPNETHTHIRHHTHSRTHHIHVCRVDPKQGSGSVTTACVYCHTPANGRELPRCTGCRKQPRPRFTSYRIRL